MPNVNVSWEYLSITSTIPFLINDTGLESKFEVKDVKLTVYFDNIQLEFMLKLYNSDDVDVGV